MCSFYDNPFFRLSTDSGSNSDNDNGMYIV